MKLLVIDTSGPVCGTAVMDEEKVYSEFTAQNRNTHSVSLMPMIEAALKAAGAELNRDFSEKDAYFADAVQAKRFTYTGWLDGADAIVQPLS